jgi:hypothetical protein
MRKGQEKAVVCSSLRYYSIIYIKELLNATKQLSVYDVRGQNSNRGPAECEAGELTETLGETFLYTRKIRREY